jgi:hypothetical protein
MTQRIVPNPGSAPSAAPLPGGASAPPPAAYGPLRASTVARTASARLAAAPCGLQPRPAAAAGDRLFGGQVCVPNHVTERMANATLRDAGIAAA